jgi:hypothetical protein
LVGSCGENSRRLQPRLEGLAALRHKNRLRGLERIVLTWMPGE